MSEEHYLRRELYELVRTKSEIFDFLQAGSLDGIWYWDIENPEHEWLSPRFKDLFGYSDDEVPHTSAWWQENIFPEDLQLVLDNFNRHCADSSHAYDQIVRYRHKDGSTVWVRCRGLVIRDEDGKPIRMLGAHTDVSALKRTEALLTQTVEQLEVMNRSMEEFSEAAAHDLRQPLRGLSNAVEFIIEDYGDRLGDDGRERLMSLGELARSLHRQIESLLEYARAGRGELSVENLSLDDAVRGAVDALLVDPITQESEIVVADAMPAVRFNRSALNSVLQNLVSNAIRYNNRDAGERRVEIGVEARDEVDPEHVCVHVRDNGIGIEERYHGRVFEMFRRLHGPGEFQGGSGAGLSIAKRLIERHGGRMWVESTRGEGSTFLFTVRRGELVPEGGTPRLSPR